MKKKTLLILGMVIVCSVFMYFAKGLQQKVSNNLTGYSNATMNEVSDISRMETSSETKTVVTNSNNTDNDTKETTTDKNSISKEGSTEKNGAEVSSTTNKVTDQVAEVPENKINSSSNNSTPTPTSVTTPSSQSPKPTEKPAPVENASLLVINTISGNIVFEKRLNVDGKQSLYTYMIEALSTTSPRPIIKSDGYVAMICGLYEYRSMPNKKKGWENSGWIYYVNGIKAPVGTKDYIPKAGDSIVWKYWKDAINEKN